VATNERSGRGWALSTKHLTGTAFALGGPALAIAGVVGAPVGIALAVPLYAIGALLAPSRKRGVSVSSDVDADAILAGLDKIEGRVRGRVPDDVQSRVDRIVNTIRETAPRASELGPGSQQVHTVVQTASDYLPEALDSYLRLPRSYADSHIVSDGKTAHQLLCDQLDLLAQEMDEVFDAVCRADVDALVTHGRFLREKFSPGSLDLGPGPSAQAPSAPPPTPPAPKPSAPGPDAAAS
jgi:hypothetical protein